MANTKVMMSPTKEMLRLRCNHYLRHATRRKLRVNAAAKRAITLPASNHPATTRLITVVLISSILYSHRPVRVALCQHYYTESRVSWVAYPSDSDHYTISTPQYVEAGRSLGPALTGTVTTSNKSEPSIQRMPVGPKDQLIDSSSDISTQSGTLMLKTHTNHKPHHLINRPHQSHQFSGISARSTVDEEPEESRIVTNRTRAKLTCDSGEMILRLEFSQPYRGITYSDSNRLSPCRFYGNGSSKYEIHLPLNGCGTQQPAPRLFANNVVVRFHRSLELEEDETKTIICNYPLPQSLSSGAKILDEHLDPDRERESDLEQTGNSKRPQSEPEFDLVDTDGGGQSMVVDRRGKFLGEPPRPEDSASVPVEQSGNNLVGLDGADTISHNQLSISDTIPSTTASTYDGSELILVLLCSILVLSLLILALASGAWFCIRRRSTNKPIRHNWHNLSLLTSNSPTIAPPIAIKPVGLRDGPISYTSQSSCAIPRAVVSTTSSGIMGRPSRHLMTIHYNNGKQWPASWGHRQGHPNRPNKHDHRYLGPALEQVVIGRAVARADHDSLGLYRKLGLNNVQGRIPDNNNNNNLMMMQKGPHYYPDCRHDKQFRASGTIERHRSRRSRHGVNQRPPRMWRTKSLLDMAQQLRMDQQHYCDALEEKPTRFSSLTRSPFYYRSQHERHRDIRKETEHFMFDEELEAEPESAGKRGKRNMDLAGSSDDNREYQVSEQHLEFHQDDHNSITNTTKGAANKPKGCESLGAITSNETEAFTEWPEPTLPPNRSFQSLSAVPAIVHGGGGDGDGSSDDLTSSSQIIITASSSMADLCLLPINHHRFGTIANQPVETGPQLDDMRSLVEMNVEFDQVKPVDATNQKDDPNGEFQTIKQVVDDVPSVPKLVGVLDEASTTRTTSANKDE